MFWGKIAGVPTYLIRPADWNACNIFRGSRIYGGSYDEKEAYLYLCRCESRIHQQAAHPLASSVMLVCV